MTPYHFAAKGVAMRVVGIDGDSGQTAYKEENSYLRPVINLKPNVLKSGDGTASNPYKIEV